MAQTVQGSLLVVSNLKSENIVDVVSIFLEADKTKIQIQDQVQVSINTSKIPIAACTIYLYFDPNKLEVIDIPENANVIEDEIIYTWFDNRTEKIGQKIPH